MILEHVNNAFKEVPMIINVSEDLIQKDPFIFQNLLTQFMSKYFSVMIQNLDLHKDFSLHLMFEPILT